MTRTRRADEPNELPTARLGAVLATQADDTLSWVTHAALDLLEGVDYVSITTVHRGEIEGTVGSTDPLALKADLMQYELDQGPCLDVALGDKIAQSADLEQDSRWPEYSTQATQLGVRSQVALRIEGAGETMGSLNLYSTRCSQFEPSTVAGGKRLAAQAATALEMTRTAGHLSRMLASRSHIAQATGLLMARHKWTSHQAFGQLVKLSQNKNVKMREIARDLVESANEDVTDGVAS